MDGLTKPNMKRCMIKRSLSIFKVLFNWSFIKLTLVFIPIFFMLLMPILIVNAIIMGYIFFETLHIPSPGLIAGIIVISTLMLSCIELYVIIACLSCIPIIERLMKRFGDWINIDGLK
jgi:hypothetical protein